jgi:hypothetical protein
MLLLSAVGVMVGVGDIKGIAARLKPRTSGIPAISLRPAPYFF